MVNPATRWVANPINSEFYDIVKFCSQIIAEQREIGDEGHGLVDGTILSNVRSHCERYGGEARMPTPGAKKDPRFSEEDTTLKIIHAIEHNGATSQRTLAKDVEIALGLTNAYL